MAGATFVAGDWGTSHLRLFLCDESGNVLDEVAGPGAAQGDFAGVFDRLVARWQSRLSSPTVLSGMVGSSIGWDLAPYLPCPARPEDIATACASLRDGHIRIVPGLSCRNRFAAPDVMRGEETQILGALQLQPMLREGRQLLCLPGTHTKWVLLEDGRVSDFLTAPTGELFALLRDRSVLVQERSAAKPGITHAFARGLAEVERFPQAQLLHRLFECRSRGLMGDLAAEDTVPFLSGLLIASDIAGALAVFADSIGSRAVHVVGSEQVLELYSAALERQRCQVSGIDGSQAAVTGLVNIRQQLTSAR